MEKTEIKLEVPISETEVTQFRPIPLRSKDGRSIKWRIPGNNTEEDFLIGIRNVQGLFLERFPEFARYLKLEDGKINPDFREDAEKFILRHLRTRRDMVDTFGLSVGSRISAPYFGGSYAVAIKKSFEAWDIDLKLGQANRKRLLNPDMVDNDGTRWVTLSTLRNDYRLDYRTLRHHLRSLTPQGGIGLNGHRVLFYPEAEARSRILEPYSRLPSIRAETNTYVDDNGESWVCIKYWTDQLGINDRTLKKLLKDITIIQGRDVNGRQTTLYKLDEGLESLRGFMTLKKTDNMAIHVDETGDRWVTLSALAQQLGVGESFIKGLNRVRHKEGKNYRGRPTNLYHEEDVKDQLREYLALPKVDKKSGIFIDQDGGKWINKKKLAKMIGVTEIFLTQERLQNIPAIKGLGMNGAETTLYQLQGSFDFFGAFMSLPVIDSENGTYQDSDGLVWIDMHNFVKRTKVSGTTIRERLKNSRRIEGRGTRGQIQLFPEQEVTRVVQEWASLPQVDSKSGIYTDEDGQEWTTEGYFRRRYGIGIALFRNRSRQFDSIVGRDIMNKKSKLFRISDFSEILEYYSNLPQVDRKTGIYIDQDSTSWVAANYFRTRFILSEEGLNSCLQQVDQISGRDKHGWLTTLFGRDDVMKILAEKGYKARKPISTEEAGLDLYRLLED